MQIGSKAERTLGEIREQVAQAVLPEESVEGLVAHGCSQLRPHPSRHAGQRETCGGGTQGSSTPANAPSGEKQTLHGMELI